MNRPILQKKRHRIHLMHTPKDMGYRSGRTLEQRRGIQIWTAVFNMRASLSRFSRIDLGVGGPTRRTVAGGHHQRRIG